MSKWPYVILVLAPIVGYGGFALNKCDDYSVWEPTLMGGVEKYKRVKAGWPKSFSELKPFLDSPNALESMDPHFQPIDNNRAVMTVRDWAHLTPAPSTYVIEFDSEQTIHYLER